MAAEALANAMTPGLPRPPKVIIFDFDGVILDSAGLKLRAYPQVYANEDADKVSAIDEYSTLHGPTGMVGDGVNDAPALAAARVSIALGGVSSGAAIETADVVLMADDLRKLPWLIRHSRATLGMIHQNIAIAVGSKLVVLALALFGLANLWMAVAADVGATLVVVANALRLLRPGED